MTVPQRDYSSIVTNKGGVCNIYRNITDLSGTPIAANGFSSIKLSVFPLVFDATNTLSRGTAITGFNEQSLSTSGASSCIGTFTAGNTNYNFHFCVDGPFSSANTTYIVDITYTFTDGHTGKTIVQVTTGD